MENIRNGDVYVRKYDDINVSHYVIIKDYLRGEILEIEYKESIDIVYYKKGENIDRYFDVYQPKIIYLGHIDEEIGYGILDTQQLKSLVSAYERRIKIMTDSSCHKFPIKYMMNNNYDKKLIYDDDKIYDINNFKYILEKVRHEISEETIILEVKTNGYNYDIKSDSTSIGRIVDFSDDYKYAYIKIYHNNIKENLSNANNIAFKFKYSTQYKYEVGDLKFRYLEGIYYAYLNGSILKEEQ